MAAKKKKPTKTWSEDEFGVVMWESFSRGDKFYPEGHDPFEKKMEALEKVQMPHGLREAATRVHDDMKLARTMAVSLFGKHWRTHIMEVYDRLVARLPKGDE
jgi:hypothetical protein